MGTLDTIIIVVIVFLGLLVFYKALKEPIDMLFGWIKNGIEYLKDKGKDKAEDTYEVIRYG